MKKFILLSASILLLFSSVALAWDCQSCGKKGNPNDTTKCPKCKKLFKFNVPCPKCKKPTLLGGEKCNSCGAKMPPHWVCQKCGKICAKNPKFCPGCGNKRPEKKTASKTEGDKSKKTDKDDDADDDDEDEDDEPEEKTSFSSEYTDEAPLKIKRSDDAKKQKKINKLIRYYTRTYSKHLENRDWFVRALAVIALNRLNCPQTTEKLLEVLKKDKEQLVKLYAWEALHARSGYLTLTQHRKWVTEGCKMAKKGTFRGDLRVGFLKALASYSPADKKLEAKPVKIVEKMVKKLSVANPQDTRTLEAMQQLITKWHDPKLTKKILSKFSGSKVSSAQKAEFLVTKLSGFEPVLRFGRLSKTERRERKIAWNKRKGKYRKWLKKQDFKTASQDDLKRYVGTSTWMPKPKIMRNPKNKTWREDLELEKLKVKRMDVCFAIDSTGSMLPVLQWVASDLNRLMVAMKRVFREPRIGVVFYRHEEDPRLKLPCCKEAGPGKTKQVLVGPPPKGSKTVKKTKDGNTVSVPPGTKTKTIEDYRTKYYKLTGNAKKLAKKIRKAEAGGTHNNLGAAKDTPAGAIHGGLLVAMKKMGWRRSSKSSKKVIVIIGDAAPTKGTMPAIEKLVKKASNKGFSIFTIKVALLPKTLTRRLTKAQLAGQKYLISFDKIAKWAKGESTFAQFLSATPDNTGRQIVQAKDKVSNYKSTLGGIIRAAIPKDYHKRINPLVNILCEYSEASPKK